MNEPLHEPAPAGRRERNAVETRRRLLDAADAEFSAKGYPGARIRNIADAVGVQSALVFHYFRDKEGLYEAVIDRALAQAQEESWTILSRAASLPELVESFIEFLLRFHSSHRSLLSIMRHEVASGGSSAGMAVLRERNGPVLTAVAAHLEKLQREGVVRADVDVRELVLAAIGMVLYPFQDAAIIEAVWPAPAEELAPLLERRKRTIVNVLLGGLVQR